MFPFTNLYSKEFTSASDGASDAILAPSLRHSPTIGICQLDHCYASLSFSTLFLVVPSVSLCKLHLITWLRNNNRSSAAAAVSIGWWARTHSHLKSTWSALQHRWATFQTRNLHYNVLRSHYIKWVVEYLLKTSKKGLVIFYVSNENRKLICHRINTAFHVSSTFSWHAEDFYTSDIWQLKFAISDNDRELTVTFRKLQTIYCLVSLAFSKIYSW